MEIAQHRYLLPVPDLTVSREWSVGRVRLLPKGSTRPLVAQRRAEVGPRPSNWYDNHLDENEASRLDEATVAEVECTQPEEAYGHVADALAVLRLLQHLRAPMVDTDFQTFGLPGQLTQWHLDFIDLNAGPGGGFVRGGTFPGWVFSNEDHEAFRADTGLLFLSNALAKDHRTRLEQRGLLGARLLSTSTLEQDPDLKLLAAVMALEVLIGDNRKGPKKFRLARRHVFLACSVATSSMCGRDRPSCPYLALEPDASEDYDVLLALRKRDKAGDVRVRCSEYYELLNLYDARNDAVHDGTAGADLKSVRNDLYRIYRWLISNVYAWYAAHPDDDDLRQLDDEIRRIAEQRPPTAFALEQ